MSFDDTKKEYKEVNSHDLTIKCDVDEAAFERAANGYPAIAGEWEQQQLRPA